MAIQVGDTLPAATFMTSTAEGPAPLTTDDIFKGKTVALFAVPGAFTPTCSAKHLPGFKDHAADLKAKGVDTIACVSVNDVFVMKAWARTKASTARSCCWPTAMATSPAPSASTSTAASSAWVRVRSAIR